MALNASPARLDIDPLEHAFVSALLERHSKHERLRDRLNREEPIAIARFEDPAAGGNERHAKFVGIGVTQFGNVGRDLAVVDARVARAQFVDKRLYFRM
jgi:hypothetical protein